MADFDLDKYLRLTTADLYLQHGHAADLETLKVLTKCHLHHARYQNYDLLLNRKAVDMSPNALMQRLLVDNRGGICYELCELFLHVLQLFKFDTLRIPVFNLGYGQEYNKQMTNTHNIVVVNLDGKKYLVDNTYGYNAIREPVEFSFEENEERSVGTDKYRLECFDDHYKLNLWLKGAWAPMYRFDRPLAEMDWDQAMDNIDRFLTSPEIIYIRDGVLKVGIITEKDRIGFQCSFDALNRKGTPPYTMITGGSSKKVNYQMLKETVEKYINIELNDDYFVQN